MSTLRNGSFAHNVVKANKSARKQKMTDAEVLAKLKTIVTIGNPDRKYNKVDKIGSGYFFCYIKKYIIH